MNWNAEILHALVAIAGGILGAAISGLGAFVLFGFLGIIAFANVVLGGGEAWMTAVTGSLLLRPSVAFLGGCVAAAYARRHGLIQCGKDIGRPFVSFQRFDVLAAGGAAGLGGWFVNRSADVVFAGKFDTIALTVFSIPLIFKYAWRMTKSSDCDAVSHAVPSPYRFFERFSRPKGKVFVALVVGFCTSILTILLYLQPLTRPYAALLGFFASAVLLFPLFMGIPVPATHHFSGTAGAAAAVWMASHEGMSGVAVLWGIAAAQIALVAADVMGNWFFTEGDVHVDPPAMAIFASTAVMVGVLPLTGVYAAGTATQAIVAMGMIAAAMVYTLRRELIAWRGVRATPSS